MNLDELEFLLGEGRQILSTLDAVAPGDALALATRLRKILPAPRARLVQEQLELRSRAVAKFGDRARGMFFTRKLLEQASGPLVARHKARRLRASVSADGVLADLCCGLGGDSFAFFEAGFDPVLVDLDPVALGLSRANLEFHGWKPRTVQARLPDLPLRPDAFHLDPDRRTAGREGGEDRWDGGGWSPDADGIRKLFRLCPAGVVKLSPGTPADALDVPGEREWVGVCDELRELVVWGGDLGRDGLWRASELDRDGHVETVCAPADEAQEAFSEDPAEEPRSWVFEPVKALVRSHLFAWMGHRRGLQLLDPTIAWMTGTRPQGSLLLKEYRVLASGPLTKGSEEALLREAGRSCGAVKKRGVAVVPETVQRQLRGLPGEPAVLCYTRVRGRKWVMVLEPGSSGLQED